MVMFRTVLKLLAALAMVSLTSLAMAQQQRPSAPGAASVSCGRPASDAARLHRSGCATGRRPATP